ncbi:MAG: hypothetical protein PHE68_00090 [Candidatus Peribacteraceae bacterium]|nr:hypothetical protein [Candidatus Peribacteraceae bacterium]MDD5075235.1 hypothetical protein [Candidatus Peribacteraceae bacterium]
MSDSWLDHIPSHERQRILKRLRSPEEYEKLREKVKGPEDLEREMERNERMAELKFAMETEPKLKSALKEQVVEDIQEHGLEEVVETSALPKEARSALEARKFTLTIDANKVTHEDQIMVVPEGNVQEAVPVKPTFSDRYVGQFSRDV